MSGLKAAHRAALGAARGALGAETAAAASQEIASRLSRLPQFVQSPAVLLYSASPEEVGTEAIRRAVEQRGVPLYYPRLERSTNEIEFVRVAPGEPLRAGAWGIGEPRGSERFAPGASGVLVVPGVGFDRNGTRLGRGWGYYDRAIRRHRPPVVVVALAFGLQLVAALPRSEWDEPVDLIVTEREIVECAVPRATMGEVPGSGARSA
jgi:5-formyltetrahydrofolate cyclo-ligase